MSIYDNKHFNETIEEMADSDDEDKNSENDNKNNEGKADEGNTDEGKKDEESGEAGTKGSSTLNFSRRTGFNQWQI